MKTSALLLLACSCFGQIRSASRGADRKPEPQHRVVLIILDGVRKDTFAAVYEKGLPNFNRIFSRALWFDHASTVTPSVTMAAQASLITGAVPSRHGVVGNQWFDREGLRLVNYMNASGLSCVYGFSLLGGPECLSGLGNRHLQAPTIYEAATAAGLSSLVVYHQYWLGATRPAMPTASEARVFLKGNTLDYQVFDRNMASRAVDELRSGGLASILTLYFAGADGVGHAHGIEAQTAYLSGVIDPLLGRVLDTIEELDPLALESTAFVLASDHGRTEASPHTEDIRLAEELIDVLPAGSHLAVNGGLAYVYLPESFEAQAPSLYAAIEKHPRLLAAIASVGPRAATDSPRSGDLTIILRPDHYFGNTGVGSHHGSIYADDLSVPLLMAMPGAPAGHVSEPVSNTQVARTIADYIGFAMDSAAPALPVPKRVRTTVSVAP